MAVRCRLMITILMVLVMSGGQELLGDEQVVQDLPSLDSSTLSKPSPRTSWLMFVNNADARRSSRKRSKGLQGPHGRPGSSLPRPHPQQLIDDLFGTLNDESSSVLCERPPRVSASFLACLVQAVRVARRNLKELRPFSQAPPSLWALQRSRGFNVSDGRYAATLSGFYLLSSRLRLRSSERVQVRSRESVRAAICVESLCHTNLSIESVVGVSSVGGAFSITLTGSLFLQAGEYVSVYVENATGASISVLPDSFFSAILLGN